MNARVAFITGGGHAGIGAATAQALARQGLAVAVTDLVSGAAEATAAALPGSGHRGYALDVTDEAQVGAVFSAAERDLGPVAVLVCCAGIMITPPAGPPGIAEMQAADWDRTFDVNARGVFLCVREFLRARAARPVAHGRIVAISSAAAQIGGYRGSADYIASKAAVIALIKVAARQAAAQGITANSVAPGPIETPMFREAVPVGGEGPMLAHVPLGRMGQPEEVAAAIAFLATPEAAYITGSTIDVNGGYRMQ
ncbi:MAG: SDR family oxidoreductase [Rhodospirillaceae bacterium]|nr:SDR family oxidoreductase [Rhodospirillaceae bacterium]